MSVQKWRCLPSVQGHRNNKVVESCGWAIYVKRPQSMQVRSRPPVSGVEVFPLAKLLASTPEYQHA